MTEIFSILWAIISFTLGLAWSLVWFVLRDLVSTLVWITIAVWAAFALRYRSFSAGSLAFLRYVRYGLVFVWRWVRGKSAAGLMPPAPVTKIVKEYRRHVPLGYISFSEELNAILVALLFIMAHV